MYAADTRFSQCAGRFFCDRSGADICRFAIAFRSTIERPGHPEREPRGEADVVAPGKPLRPTPEPAGEPPRADRIEVFRNGCRTPMRAHDQTTTSAQPARFRGTVAQHRRVLGPLVPGCAVRRERRLGQYREASPTPIPQPL